MQIQFGAKLIGIMYIAIGILGLIPIEALNPYHSEGVGATYLLRHIAVNWLHDGIHLVIGFSGLWASRTMQLTRLWGKVFGVTLLVIFAAGMVQAMTQDFPADQMLFGLVPLNSPGHMLHLVTGGIALYIGFAKPGTQITPGDLNVASAKADDPKRNRESVIAHKTGQEK